IVALHRLDRGGGYFERRESKDPLALRIYAGKARILDHHRLAHRQVAGAAAAEPTAVCRHIGLFRDRPLAARAGDVVAVAIHRRRTLDSLDYAPAFAGDLVARRRTGERDLERRRHVPRQRHETTELYVLPAIDLAAERWQRRLRLPRHYGREAPRRRVEGERPIIERDRLAGHLPVDPAARDDARRIIDRLRHREVD